MLLSYSECLHKWQSDYQIKKQIYDGKLFQIEKGVYSDVPDVSKLAVIAFKYPKGIITMNSAFYYHGLTDVIPDKFHIATDKHAIYINDDRVHQYYVLSNILNTGVTTIERRDATFKIYDKERMLIELLRFKNKIPFDYYKEIIGNYRDIIYDLDIERIQDYAESFPRSKMICDAIELEVL
ncbi:MAG: hypothetical protein IKN47_08155 [Lachnospiraceae bacterium]|nr:hypothetical protein [Lachnospiraceae bacterium]